MNTVTVKTWSNNGEQRFSSCEARKVLGISNRGTWNDYLISIGLPTGKFYPVLRMTDLIWAAIARRWMRLGKRKTVSTHKVFRFLRVEKNWELDDFLNYLNTDLLTITTELRGKING